MSGAMQVAILVSMLSVTLCEGTSPPCGESGSCAADAPRAGGAMIQHSKDFKKDEGLEGRAATVETDFKKDDGLEGRVATVEAEILSLESRVSIVQTTATGGATLSQIREEKEKQALAQYAKLLKGKLSEGDVTTSVTDLEQRAKDLNTKITALEGTVSGTKFELIQEKATDVSLTSRVTALEELTTALRMRTKALEHLVALASLAPRVATVEAEIDSLESRVSILQTTVSGAATLSQIDEKENKGITQYAKLLNTKLTAGDVTTVVVDLEQRARDLKTKITALEGAVSGTQFELIQEKATDPSLTSRITALEEVTESLRSRTKALEKKVSLGSLAQKSAK